MAGTGSVAGTATYDAYGRVLTQTGTRTPCGYAGEYTAAATGLQYLRARSYDPATQQFLTVDPLLAQTEQAYAYAGGSPTNATDPSGKLVVGICLPGVSLDFFGGGAASPCFVVDGNLHFAMQENTEKHLGTVLGASASASVELSWDANSTNDLLGPYKGIGGTIPFKTGVLWGITNSGDFHVGCLGVSAGWGSDISHVVIDGNTSEAQAPSVNAVPLKYGGFGPPTPPTPTVPPEEYWKNYPYWPPTPTYTK
ncbi:MAG: RHS repeat-associated core domain-containing protein [Ktedonobacteraceae bacterium]|nr:RHS repeat-associated core domain-containing protein [Ktedonobacteraceae bacterium]